MASVGQNDAEGDQALVLDAEIRRQLRSVVDLLEGGLSELVKIAAELRSLIRTIDEVTKQVESHYAVNFGKDCCHNASLECWCRGSDINQNLPTQMSEVHWQTYASQDWFSGFKHFPRLKDARDSIASFANSSSSRPFCKYYDQIAEVLLQIGKILNSLETSHTCKDDPSRGISQSDVSFEGVIPVNDFADAKRLTQSYSDNLSCSKKSPISSESSFDRSQNSYLSVLVDINGDYEETLDYLLESVTGTDVEEDEESSDSDKNDEPSDEPPPVPVLKVYLRKYIDDQNNNSAMKNLQTYFD